MRSTAALALALAGCLAWAAISAQNPDRQVMPYPAPPEVRVVPDLQLTATTQSAATDEVPHFDLLLPPRMERPSPAIVVLGGGAGPRRPDQVGATAARLASRGFVAAVIDYRPRVVENRPPIAAVMADARRMMDWLRRHAEEYGVDPLRIGVLGVSHGGLVAMGVTLPRWITGVSGTGGFAAVVIVEPLLDLADTSLGAEGKAYIDEALGPNAASAGTRNSYTAANYLSAETTPDVLPHVPPVLLVHGTADTVFPYAPAASMAMTLRRQGFKAESFDAIGAGHGVLTSPEWGPRASAAIDEFLDRVLAGGEGHPGWADSHPAWSPDGSRLAFESDYPNESGIWVMNADGSNARWLASGAEPTWSPDGSKIAFTAQGGQLVVVNADGSGLTSLTTEKDGWMFEPAWSPDGRQVVFGNYGCCDERNLWVLRVADRQLTRLTSTGKYAGCAGWSADSAEIVYHAEPPGFDVYRTRLADGTTVRVAQTAANEFCPRESPDGRLIAFQRRADDRHVRIDLWVMRADGTGEINLTNHPANDRYASWSPDGRWIAFSSTRGGNYDIYIVRPDGSELRRLTTR